MITRKSLPRRRLIASAVALFVLGFTMLTPAFGAEPKVLVGLGDSYSSGLGNTDTGSCGRSDIAFPTLAAQWLDAQGQNFACSGATAEAFDQPFDGQGPQLDLLREVQADTGVDYVALTIGGNDIGVLRGVAGLLSGAALPNFEQSIQAEVPNLTNAYEEIRDAAPDADVYVLGYPNIFPTDNSVLDECIGTDFDGRIDMANGVTAFNLMNSGLESAVDATNDSRIHFVPVDTFSGHDFCSDEPWAYGLTGRGLLHPNEAGHDEMARLLANAISETPDAPKSTSTTSSTSTTTSAVQATTTTVAELTPVGGQEVPIVEITTTPTTAVAPATTVAPEDELIEVIGQASTTTSAPFASTTTSAAPTATTSTTQAPTTTTSTSSAPIAVVTTSTSAPEVLAETTEAPKLAYTGASSTAYLALACLLTGIGLSLLWLRLLQRDRMARMVIPVRVK